MGLTELTEPINTYHKNNPLCRNAKSGSSVDLARFILQQLHTVAPPGGRLKIHRAPFDIACKKGNLAFIKIWINESFDAVDKEIDILDGILSESIEKKYMEEVDLATVSFLIENVANVNGKSEDYWSSASGLEALPLLVAAAHGELEIAEHLVKNGAYINTQTILPNQDQPLHEAIKHSKWEISNYLLEQGADINGRGMNQATPLHYAAAGWITHSVFWDLLDRGAAIDARDCEGWTALHYACFESNHSFVRILVDEAGVELQPKDNSGLTPLHLAASCSKHHDNIRELLAKHFSALKIGTGAEIAFDSPYIYTEYSIGCGGHCKHFAIVEYLIEKGAQANEGRFGLD